MSRILNLQPRAHADATVPNPGPPAKKPPVGTRNQWQPAARERNEDVGEALRSLAQSAHNRAAALKEIAEKAIRITGADGFAIALSQGSAVVCECSIGFAPQVGSGIRDGGLSAQCLRLGRMVKCDDLHKTAEQSGAGVRSALIIPVLQEGHAIGLLAAFSQSTDAFDDDHVTWMMHAAGAVASMESVKEAARRRVSALLTMQARARHFYTVTPDVVPELIAKVRGWSATQKEIGSACATASLSAAVLAVIVLLSPRIVGMPFWLWLSALPLGIAAISSGHYARLVASRTGALASRKNIAGIAVGYAVVFTLIVLLATMYGDV